jgi:tartrate dehydratase alpha subunit/fumarate hydratase class I-like protein
LSQANYSQEDITEVLAAIIEKWLSKIKEKHLKQRAKITEQKKSSLTAWIINQMIKRQNS